MRLREVSQSELDVKPYLLWNAFVDLLATEEYGDLAAEQQSAHLVFWYDSEVQNGGHFQYFENRGTTNLAETVAALGLLGANCQQKILREAGDQWLSRPRVRIQTVEEFCETGLKGEFDDFDARFYKCQPELTDYLEEELTKRQSLYVKIID